MPKRIIKRAIKSGLKHARRAKSSVIKAPNKIKVRIQQKKNAIEYEKIMNRKYPGYWEFTVKPGPKKLSLSQRELLKGGAGGLAVGGLAGAYAGSKARKKKRAKSKKRRR